MPYSHKRGFSNHIRPALARDLDAAAKFAEMIGRPLNTCIDINWARTSIGDDPNGDALRLVLKRLRRWLARHDHELYAAWARENPKKGPNSHIMLHLPRDLLRALQQVGADILLEGCLDLDGKAVHIHATGDTEAARTGRLKYLLKAVRPGRIADALDIRPENQGRVLY